MANVNPFHDLTTAHVADACIRVGAAVRCAPAAVRAVLPKASRAAGLAGIVIWGLHRDTADLDPIGLPVFSMGSIPTGPLALTDRHPDGLASARVGEWIVTTDDYVVADRDGVLFIPAARTGEIAEAATAIRDTERRQAEQIRQGTSLRAQLRFADYLAARTADPALTFRAHLRAANAAIEE